MSIPGAYLAVVVIWATTPLAVKWSGEGLGPMPAAASRMLIAAGVGFVLLQLLRIRLPWSRDAVASYFAAGTSIFGAMSLIYWGALYVPSGLISVLFGLSPIVAGVVAQRWLGESELTALRWIACLVALMGLVVIFWHELQVEGDAWIGIVILLVAVVIFSISSVWVKRVGAKLHPFAQTVGALIVCAPPYALSWWWIGGPDPSQAAMAAYGAVLYLALGGSLLGFLCYFHVLRHLPATTVALITVMTPVLALGIGAQFNDESLPATTLIGTGMIVAGLAIYHLGDRVKRRLRMGVQ